MFFTTAKGQLPHETRCAKNDALEVELSASRTQDTALSAVVEKTAEFTTTSYETVKRDWSFTIAWLHRALKEAHGDPC